MRSICALSFSPILVFGLKIPQHIPLTCQPGVIGHVEQKTGCLRGQICIAEDVCATSNDSLASAITPRQGTTAPRPDGRCGSAFNGATCDPTGPYGGCCSSYGYCGKTPAHCLLSKGCQNGCTTPSSTVASIASTTQEPVIGSPSTGPSSGGGTTTNGTCGAAYGGTTCGNWPQGPCCSKYGTCNITRSI